MRKLEDIVEEIKVKMGAKDLEVSEESMDILKQVQTGKMTAKTARKLMKERLKG